MTPELEAIQNRVVNEKQVTRQDVYEILKHLKETGRTSEFSTVVTEIASQVYDSDTVKKIVSDIPSYGIM